MKCAHVNIHLKEDTVPYVAQVPIPIPLYWKADVNSNLDKDVESGIIELIANRRASYSLRPDVCYS